MSLTFAAAIYGKMSVMSLKANIHLVLGEDDYLVESAARKILNDSVSAGLRGSAVEKINGDAGNADAQLASLRECEASVMTPPFLDPVKLTWWRNVTFLPGGGKNGKLSEEVKTALENFAKNLAANPLPPNQFLIITGTKLLQTSVFAKTLKPVCEFQSFASEARANDRTQAALARVGELAAAEGLKFEPGTDLAFITKVGTDTRFIVSELAKLRAYLGKGSNTITQSAISEISSVGAAEPELWEFTDAVGSRNSAKFISLYSRIEGENGTGILLSTILEKFFREMIVYRSALDAGFLTNFGTWAQNIPEETAKQLNETGLGPATNAKPWALKRAVNSARAYSMRELRVARFRILSVREKLVSSTADDSLVKTEILRIMAKPRMAVRAKV